MFEIQPKHIPSLQHFSNVIKRFDLTGSVHQQKSTGRPVSQITEENIASVKVLIEDRCKISIRSISSQLNMSYKADIEKEAEDVSIQT